jgi:uncharacterized protein (UPF0332 family)
MAEFNRVSVKDGVFGPEMFKSLQLGFDMRSQGDYSILPVPRERAEGLLLKAREFVATVSEFLAGEA